MCTSIATTAGTTQCVSLAPAAGTSEFVRAPLSACGTQAVPLAGQWRRPAAKYLNLTARLLFFGSFFGFPLWCCTTAAKLVDIGADVATCISAEMLTALTADRQIHR